MIMAQTASTESEGDLTPASLKTPHRTLRGIPAGARPGSLTQLLKAHLAEQRRMETDIGPGTQQQQGVGQGMGQGMGQQQVPGVRLAAAGLAAPGFAVGQRPLCSALQPAPPITLRTATFPPLPFHAHHLPQLPPHIIIPSASASAMMNSSAPSTPPSICTTMSFTLPGNGSQAILPGSPQVQRTASSATTAAAPMGSPSASGGSICTTTTTGTRSVGQ
ncbi:hypothetical protein PAPYR_2514 [Paratrimastix pyriformis]|uniref:Uncharacterized protein n=1 Tax=Paratrimastix pyriformis TaxID=342808 RepID=A0ABQ8UWD3_9EUKA|nr:hypothetical protein PAPYR_2514 [Paratrimastix pyriformis]